MARPFSLCLVVTLLIVFAVIEATPGQTNQDGQKVQNRGTARYQNSKLTSELSDFTTRSPRDKSFRSETVSNLEKNETKHFERESSFRSRSKLSRTIDGSAVTSQTNARYLNSSVDNSRNRPRLHTTQASKEKIIKSRHDNKENVPESQTQPKQPTISRRTSSDASSIWVDNAKLDQEVFTKSSDHLRSRTGRKIYRNDNGKELRSQMISSRKSANEDTERNKNPISNLDKTEARSEYPRRVENITSVANLSRMMDTKKINDSNNRKEEGTKERDVLLLGSESILRVDVPLTTGTSENANIRTSTTISSVSSRQTSRLIKEKVESNDIAGSNAKSKQSHRSRPRNISNANNSETAKSESILSRRNSSRLDDTGTNGRSSNAKRRSNATVNSRNRSTHKSRDTNTIEARDNDRNKNADTNSETNASGRTNTRRNLSNNRRTSEEKRRFKNDRKLKVTEAKIDKQNGETESENWSSTVNSFDVITTPKATIVEAMTVSSLDTEIATFSSASATIRSSTVTRISSSTEQVSRNKKRDRKEDSRSREPPKEDFFNHGLGFRGRRISTEATSSTDLKTTTLKSETQLPGNPGWTLKRRPNYVNHDISSTTAAINQNQTNEIILPNDLSSTEKPLSNAKAVRRGTKRPKAKDENNSVSGVASKNVTRGSKTFNKSEDFDLPKAIESEESDNYPLAFRARLSQLKNSNSKLTDEKSTARTSLQATKKSSPTSLFSERSKQKLDLARRLIKPELNVDENNSVPYSGKSQVKENTVNEEENVEKTTKATSELNVSPESSLIANAQKEKSIIRGRWKILQAGKSLKDRNNETLLRSSTIKKNRIPSDKAISSPMEETSMSSISKFNPPPRRITIPHRSSISVEKTTATTFDTTKVQSSRSQSTTMAREKITLMSTNVIETRDENNIVTTIEPLKLDKTSTIEKIKSDKLERDIDDRGKKIATTLSTTSIMEPHTTEFVHEVTLSPTVTSSSIVHSLTTESSKKLYPVYIPDAKKYDSSEGKISSKFANNASKNVFQPRYTKQNRESDKVTVSMVTSMTVGPTSRYIRKKSGDFTPYDTVSKLSSTEATSTQTKRKEFRPRTATYRRHSEVRTSQLTIQSSTGANQETTVSSDNTPLIFTESSISNSSESNIFNPTRSALLTSNTSTLLEQLRSTVAPLLNTLSNKSPIFSGSYSNVNIGNSAPIRITPNGSPPRFSARYKGAELFVRKPSINQGVIPSITTSSTTASTPIENSGLAPPVHINNPGEPRFITFYQALESASIRNENLGVNDDVSQRRKLTGGVTKVDSNATVPNGVSNDTANNNDSPISVSIATTSFPDIITVDTTTAAQSADLSLASRLATEIVPDTTPKITSTTTQIPANSDTSEQNTTAPIMESTSGTNISDNTMTSTPASPNISSTLMLPNVSTIEMTTIETSTNVDVTPDTLPTTEFTSDNVRSNESVDTFKSMEITSSPTIETTITDTSTPAFLMNLQISTDTSDTTTPFSTTESAVSLETTTMSMMNNISDNENIEMNTVQQYDETTETKNIVENIEINTIRQFDATVPSQMMETTSTTEFITTEEISNNIIENQVTEAPVVTTTFRTRLIDMAQNILSQLQGNFSTSTQTPDQKINTRDMANSSIIQNTRDSSINTEITTVSRLADFIMKNDSRLSNDTLLTELMTIAKTLFSEEMNETQQSSLVSDQISNADTTINPDIINNFIQTDGMMENDKNRLVFSNETSETTDVSTAELSTTLESTSERIDFENETEESPNRGIPTLGSDISLMEFNPAQSTDIQNSIDDTTATTIAQGTAVDSRLQPEQPTETTTTITISSEFPAVDTTTILSIEPTTDTSTTTSTSTTTTETFQTTSTESSSRADLATTVGSMLETTSSTIDINENLISTETTTIDARGTMIASIESENTTTSSSPVMNATTISPTTQITMPDRMTPSPMVTSFGNLNTLPGKPYPGFFSSNQATTSPSRFSSSSKAPVRDYQIYGIYPNKTIVRKRPEDNLIDARNVNSPYVIFGIFPDGRLVRKFPNGTIIPDSPRNPVEVVFTLSTTTTTNRPASGSFYNQVNQAGIYNQITQSPGYYSRPVDKLTEGVQSPSPIDFGLTGNTIGVPSGVGPKFATSFGPPASAPCANKMSDILLNIQNLPNVASRFGKLQSPIGSSIIPDCESSEASRTKITSDQHSSVYIGQDKFINYQIDNAPDVNPKVIDVKINSVATSVNEGTGSITSIPSFENLLNNQSGDGVRTASSDFPWKDPLDQIFGITTNSPIQTASVASNRLNEPAENNVPKIMPRPINPLVEVFTPVVSGVTPTNLESKSTTVLTTTPITTSTISTSTNKAAMITAATTTTTTTTTTAAPTTTPTTTTTTPITTTTTTTTTTSTTPTTTTIRQTTSSASIIPRHVTTVSSTNANTLSSSNIVPSSPATISTDNILNGLQTNTKENPFGTTFEDLTFLNSLLQNQNVKPTSKTLNEIEQMLANRILALALARPELTRSPKAINTANSNSNLNAIKDLPSSEPSSKPITIDLLAYSSTSPPSVSSSSTSTTKKYIEETRTTTLAQPSKAPSTTTRAPVVITAKSKTTTRPKTTTTTTQAPTGLGVNLWRALFGSNNPSEATTLASARQNPKPATSRSVQTTQRSVEITQRPIRQSTTQTSHIMSAIRSHATPRSVDISDIQVTSTKAYANNVDSVSVSTPSSISTRQALLNNPNPRLTDVSTSTYSSEDDAKFLVALLRTIQTETKTSTSATTHKVTEDDEAFLRAILNNQAIISTMPPSSTEVNPAALLALLLKQQGIEPSTPAIKVREQLQLASLDLTTTRPMTTTTSRPISSSSTQSVITTKRKTNTPRQSSRSSLRTSTLSPSLTYPPPLFGENSGSGLITATRAIGQFLGAAITGAAQQLQSFLRRNNTRSIAG